MAGRARRERLNTHQGDGPGQPGADAGLPRVYDPGVVENGIYERWLAADVFAPDGALIGKIKVPEVVANVCFGGPKRNRLYICATTSLYAVYVNARGASWPT